MTKMYRQGDVLIISANEIPENVTKISIERCVLAEGEATGHAHVAIGSDMTLYEDSTGVLWLSAPNSGQVIHEEHGTIMLTPGSYKIVRQVEWTDEMEPRRVAD
jgi:hypothetical protein